MSRYKSKSLRKFERLEDRRMMAADFTFDNGQLTVQGTDAYDGVALYVNPDDDDEVVLRISDGAGNVLLQEDFDLDDVDLFVVDALAGNDNVFNYTDIPCHLYGGNGNDFLVGGGGNDLLEGGLGDDRLAGYGGNDQLVGGIGNDVYYFGQPQEGSDVIIEGANQDYDYLHFIGAPNAINLNLASTAAQVVSPDLTLRLTSDTAIEIVFGTYYNDTIRGNSRDNALYGEGGSDSLYGGLGNDVLYGGDGNDTLLGDAGDDQLHGDNGNDVLYGFDGNDSLYGDAGDDIVFGGNGNDALWGGDGTDSLFGEAGNDYLYGENGLDYLYGGAGADRLDGGNDFYVDKLKGGEGNDKFILYRRKYREVVDEVLDYSWAYDQILTSWA